MNIVKELLYTVNSVHLFFLSNKKLVLLTYLFIFIILFLENAILPAFFLPGDSLLIFVGILVEKGILNIFITISLLTIAVSLGSWMSYLQGKFCKNKKILQYWLSRLPRQYNKKAHHLFNTHGLFALFIGRFIILIRTVLPTLAGVSDLNNFKFQLFNWISSFFWVLILISIGFILSYSGWLLF